MRVVNPRISSREVLSIISNLAQSQHGLGAQDKKCVWAINNFPEHGSEPGHVPQVGGDQEPTEPSKQTIRTSYLCHVTGYLSANQGPLFHDSVSSWC